MEDYDAVSRFLRALAYPKKVDGASTLLPPPVLHASKDGVTRRYVITQTAMRPVIDGTFKGPAKFTCEVIASPVDEKE
jgi:hypothetical protein